MRGAGQKRGRRCVRRVQGKLRVGWYRRRLSKGRSQRLRKQQRGAKGRGGQVCLVQGGAARVPVRRFNDEEHDVGPSVAGHGRGSRARRNGAGDARIALVDGLGWPDVLVQVALAPARGGPGHAVDVVAARLAAVTRRHDGNLPIGVLEAGVRRQGGAIRAGGGRCGGCNEEERRRELDDVRERPHGGGGEG